MKWLSIPLAVRKDPMFQGLIVVALFGCVLAIVFTTIPVYDDPERAAELRSAPIPKTDELREEWYRDMHEVRSLRYPLMDWGTGLVGFSTTLLAVMTFKRTNFITAIRTLKTPRTTLGFIGIGTLTLIGLFISFYFSIFVGLARGYHPWWADSVSIPLFALQSAAVHLFPICIILGFITVWRSPLPVSIGHWDHSRRARSIFWTVVFGGLAAAAALSVLASIPGGGIMEVVALVVALYLFLAARAAIIARHGFWRRRPPATPQPGDRPVS